VAQEALRMSEQSPSCVVIGGGPAGLTAAYELSKLGRSSIVLEGDEVVGGLSRTCEYKGYRFDVGGHRFFTKVDYVQELWEEILGQEFLSRPRLSRIYYRGKLFDYPLKPANALLGLGLAETMRVATSYLHVFFFPKIEERNFEDWVCNRFGRRLYEIFFKTYTEKVWGMPCREISADWAAQRIKNLDLVAAVKNALLGGSRKKGEVVTTLIDEFQYPRYGPGQMWTRCSMLLEERGSRVQLNTRVKTVRRTDDQVTGVVCENGSGDVELDGEQFLSSMPIRDLLHSFDPPPPKEVMEAADQLRYRDFLTVALMIDREDLFPDNWIYIHSDDVRVGRIQNYKNWSPDMVPDPKKTALGLEYFVQEGDDLWTMPDDELVELGRMECDRLGLAPAEAIEDGTVLRMRKAYPVYDDNYKKALDTIQNWLGTLDNLELVGRNGQHRYNNQDHSMMTGVYAARNITGQSYDVWGVNVEDSYHEEKEGSSGKGGGRAVPEAIRGDDLQGLIQRAFAHYDPVGLAVASAVILGLGVFLTALIPLLQDNEKLTANVSLLGAYLFGFEISWAGALIGLLEGVLIGGLFGYCLARLINMTIRHEENVLLRRMAVTSSLASAEGDRP